MSDQQYCRVCGRSSERYWEGRWRDERVELDRLRAELEKAMWIVGTSLHSDVATERIKLENNRLRAENERLRSAYNGSTTASADSAADPE